MDSSTLLFQFDGGANVVANTENGGGGGAGEAATSIDANSFPFGPEAVLNISANNSE